MSNAYHDNDHVPVLLATSSSDGVTPVLVWADPVTHRLLVTSTGGATVYTETPSGLINGSNTSYTTAHTITTIYSFAINGQYLHPGVSFDYTFSGSTITFNTALPSSLSGTGFTIVYS